MDRKYAEILCLCEVAASKVISLTTPFPREKKEDVSSFIEDFIKVEDSVQKLKKGTKTYPLLDIIKKYNLDKTERILLYFYYGAKSSTIRDTSEYPMPLLKSLSDNEPLKLFNMKLQYFSSTSKLIKEKILLPYNCGLVLNIQHFHEINCQHNDEPVHFDVPSVADIYKHLSSKVIGQEYAKKILSTVAHRHYSATNKIKKSNVILIGPTGSGKTYLVKTLAEYLNVPVLLCSANEYTCSGYVGKSVDEIMISLFDKVEGNRKKAERAIVFIDEIDKISAKIPTGHYSDRDVAGRSVQEELLNIIEAKGAREFVSHGRFCRCITMNPENILFIAAGAFSGIETFSKREKTPLGFTSDVKNISGNTGRIKISDIESFGFIPEFLGRFSNIISLAPLTCADMVNIMKFSNDSPLHGYSEYFAQYDINLSVTDEALYEIAHIALERKTGARGLNSTLEEIFNPLMYDIETGGSHTDKITIDKQDIARYATADAV